MPSKRVFDDRTRQFNERRIERNLTSWGNGLILDTQEPSKAFEDMYNAVDHGTEIRGRQGSLLYNLADYGINVDNSETFAQALSGGVLDGAVVGEKFIVYNFVDFSGADLLTAKMATVNGIYYTLPYAYDVYEIIFDGVDKPKFVGNILVPYHLDLVPLNDGGTKYFYGTKVGNEVAITSVNLIFGASDVIGKYLLYGKKVGDNSFFGFRERITNYTINGEATLFVETTDNPDDYEYLMIQPRIWSNHYYQKKNMLFMHCGKKIYYTTIPFFGWKECEFLTVVEPSEGKSQFEQIGSELILTDSNSKFRFMFKDDDVFVWVMNSDFDKLKPKNEIKSFFGFQSSLANLDSENPYKSAGFSGRDILLDPDRRGGQWL